MSIIRRQRLTYSNIDNRIINDRRLTLKALGLLTFMLSKPNDWVFSLEHLGEVWGEGRDAMRSVFKTLRESGYMRHEIVRNEFGHVRTVTIISELPEDGFSEVQETREVENPPPGEPTPLVNTDSNKLLNNNKGVDENADGELFGAAPPKVKKTRPEKCATLWNAAKTPTLPDKWREEVLAIGLDNAAAEYQFAQFSDYWSARNDAKARKADWTATFRGWCRRAHTGDRGGTGSNGKNPRADRAQFGGWSGIKARVTDMRTECVDSGPPKLAPKRGSDTGSLGLFDDDVCSGSADRPF